MEGDWNKVTEEVLTHPKYANLKPIVYGINVFVNAVFYRVIQKSNSNPLEFQSKSMLSHNCFAVLPLRGNPFETRQKHNR